MIYEKDSFYDIDGVMIMCGECVNDWKAQTERGKFTEDEVYRPDLVIGKIVLDEDTAAQCDGCLKQSDNYDDVTLGSEY